MIRDAHAGDRDQIHRLYQMLVPNSRSMHVLAEQIERIKNDPSHFLLVYEEEGELRGTLTLNICLQALHGTKPYGIIENIVVDEKYRSQGIGRKLMQYVEEYCRTIHCHRIMLLSNSKRTDAHKFFEREGFDGSVSKGFKKYLR